MYHLSTGCTGVHFILSQKTPILYISLEFCFWYYSAKTITASFSHKGKLSRSILKEEAPRFFKYEVWMSLSPMVIMIMMMLLGPRPWCVAPAQGDTPA